MTRRGRRRRRRQPEEGAVNHRKILQISPTWLHSSGCHTNHSIGSFDRDFFLFPVLQNSDGGISTAMEETHPSLPFSHTFPSFATLGREIDMAVAVRPVPSGSSPNLGASFPAPSRTLRTFSTAPQNKRRTKPSGLLQKRQKTRAAPSRPSLSSSRTGHFPP